MKDLTPCAYRFNDFRLDAERFALYHHGELVREIEKKSLQVLAAILESPDGLVTHEEIIERVWHDNLQGVTPARVNHYVSKLRKVFTKYEPDLKFIESSKGLGYVFTAEVEFEEERSSIAQPEMPGAVLDTTETVEETIADTDRANSSKITGNRRRLMNAIYVFAGVSIIALVVVSLWKWYPSRNDEEEIRSVVRDSQMYESLVLYERPSTFKEEDLDKYWTTELDVNGNYDRRRIRDAVKKLIDDGRHYGDETKCEQFEFQSVEVDKNGEYAIVKTLEKWFVSVYLSDGSLQKNRYVGPYFVSYILRKTGSRWLIEKSNTARINRPIPQLSDIQTISNPVPEHEFFVRIAGKDLEPETIYLEVVGPGCPESKPCKVPNTALMEKAKLTDTTLDNVPLTLASGDFRIIAHNGESQGSNPVDVKVP